MTVLNHYIREPLSGEAPKQVVILLHGYGADGQDLIGLAELWAEALPDAVFISPDAPFPCEMAPWGRQWFSLHNFTSAGILEGVKVAAPILNEFIDQCLDKYGLDDSALALIGFSQGTMMSLYVAPRRKKAIAGVLGYSGALVGDDELSGPHIMRCPVCLIHGDADTVVTPDRHDYAFSALTSHGFKVSGGLEAGLTHSISERGVADGRAFLKEIFAS